MQQVSQGLPSSLPPVPLPPGRGTQHLASFVDTVWTPPDDVRYARAVASVRVKERELLTDRHLRSVAEVQDLDAALAELEDTAYGPGLAGLTHSEEFEDVLLDELSRAYRLFSQLCLEPRVEQWLRLRHDAANIKAILKGGSAELPVSPVAIVKPEVLRSALEAEDYRELPALIAWMVASAASVAEKEGLLSAELLLDRQTFEMEAQLVRHRRDPFLRKLQEIRADLANLATVIRLNRLERPRTEAQSRLAPGGSFEEGFWIGIAGMPLEEIQEAFLMTDYHSLVVQSLDHVEGTGSFTLLERLCEDCAMRHLREAKTRVFGVEPLAAFVLAKEHEAAMLRMILVGKQNRIPSQHLVERIGICYA